MRSLQQPVNGIARDEHDAHAGDARQHAAGHHPAHRHVGDAQHRGNLTGGEHELLRHVSPAAS